MSRLAHLRTFLEVYRQKSISKASTKLSITQPAVTQHIQALEMLVGKKLFIRQARGVQPTEVADELAHSVSQSIDILENKLASFSFGQVTGGTVHIASPADIAHFLLAKPLASLLADDFSVRVLTGNRERIYQLLDDETVDFAVTSSPPNAQKYEFEPLFAERFLLVYAPSLAHKIGKQANADRLQALPCLAFDDDLPLIRDVWQALFGEKPNFQAACTVADLRTVKEMALQGVGWTVLADFHCQTELQQGKLLCLNSPETAPKNTLYLVWRKHARLSPNLQYVKNRVVESLKNTA